MALLKLRGHRPSRAVSDGRRTSWLFDENDLEFCRLAGIRVMVCGLDSGLPDPQGPMRAVKTFADQWLSAEIAGPGMLKFGRQTSQWTFCELQPEIVASRAWTFPLGNRPGTAVDPRLLLVPPPGRRRMLDTARPARKVFDWGDTVELTGTNDSPSVLVLSDLHYPGWEAVVTQGRESRRVAIERAFGDWRAVKIANPGAYRVTFTYRPASFRLGCQITVAGLLVWATGYVMIVLWTTGVPVENEGRERSIDE